VDPSSNLYKLQIRTFNEISAPSTRYVFVEAAETRNWNSSHHFVMAAPEYSNLAAWGWWGPIAINHGDSSVLGFTDAEMRAGATNTPSSDKLITQNVATYGIEYPRQIRHRI
jgi:hypothetical protein